VAKFSPLTAEIGLPVWDTQANFNRFRCLGFVTAAMSLTGGQPNFARSLVIWAATIYIYILGGFCPLTEFCHVQNSLCVQVLPCSILAAFLHGTPAAGLSQTLWRGTRNGITELSQRAPPIFGWVARPSRWASAYILVMSTFYRFWDIITYWQKLIEVTWP